MSDIAPNENQEDNPPIRIPLGESLESRDGTLTKDALITNGFVEQFGGGVTRVYKRSGLSALLTPASGTGFGMTSLVDANGVESLWYATASGTISQYASSYSMTASNANTPDIGYTVASTSPYAFTQGTLSPAHLGVPKITAIVANGVDGTFTFALDDSTLAQTFFTSVTINSNTFLTSAASTFSNDGGSAYVYWQWSTAMTFSNGVSYTMTIVI